MTKEELIENQKAERTACSDAIVNSTAPKKVIVAGAGTGKTFTFQQVLRANGSTNNLAMTFINMLANDMRTTFGDIAEVKTFHAFCKKVLHAQNGRVTMIPFLTKIIEEDAVVKGTPLTDVEGKFQRLEDDDEDVKFYLVRGDYYDAVSFDDSVYRLYKALQERPEIIPQFDQIVIDEYQDFNPLEVTFIKELENKGNLLIVGDDDQAVYSRRNASPDHLREVANSANYENLELPFCSRCTQVVVDATNTFIENAFKNGNLKGRVEKRYECFVHSKDADSAKYPQIVTVQCTTGPVVAKYVDAVIESINNEEIAESWKEGNEYSTVLVIGPKQYLSAVQKALGEKYPQMFLKTSDEIGYSVVEAYKLLLNDRSSNLGWRVLSSLLLDLKTGKSLVEKSLAGTPFRELLDEKFVSDQELVLSFIESLKDGLQIDDAKDKEIRDISGEHYDSIAEEFSPKDAEEKKEPDKAKPSILLTSFVGCKGLSAGHVVIIGANNASIPKNPATIDDVEIAQFVVALTRTRKQCHIVSNTWLIAPKLNGEWQPKFSKSSFLDWIPSELIDNKGSLRGEDFG